MWPWFKNGEKAQSIFSDLLLENFCPVVVILLGGGLATNLNQVTNAQLLYTCHNLATCTQTPNLQFAHSGTLASPPPFPPPATLQLLQLQQPKPQNKQARPLPADARELCSCLRAVHCDF